MAVGLGVLVGRGVFVGVFVGVEVDVGVKVGVCVGVDVGVLVAVKVGVLVFLLITISFNWFGVLVSPLLEKAGGWKKANTPINNADRIMISGITDTRFLYKFCVDMDVEIKGGGCCTDWFSIFSFCSAQWSPLIAYLLFGLMDKTCLKYSMLAFVDAVAAKISQASSH